MLVTCHNNVRDFAVLEPEVNFSDHLPLFATVAFSLSSCDSSAAKSRVEFQLRWDKADCESYYQYTGTHLTLLINVVDDMLEKCAIDGGSTGDYHDRIEYVCNSIVHLELWC